MDRMYVIKRNRVYSSSGTGFDDKPTHTPAWMSPIIAFLNFLYSVYTFCAFCFTCSLIPLLFVSYLWTRTWHGMCLKWLERKYPGLEFVKEGTVRTIVDTHRNQGIITVLLRVSAPCQLSQVRNSIQSDLVEQVCPDGKYKFPHLRTLLTSRWGCYAWVKGTDAKFNLMQHIVQVPAIFKGRPVSESNIQDYVTDIVSKYLPSEIPPWQVALIPCGLSKSYLLLRLHHLYLSEDKLSLGDLLLLRDEHGSNSASYSDADYTSFSNPLLIPMVLVRIYELFHDSVANYWNEFVSLYDPVENPSVLKAPPCIIFLLRTSIAAAGAAVLNYWRFGGDFMITIKLEGMKRSLSPSLIYRSIINSLDPINLFVSYIRWVWWCVGKAFRAPGTIIALIKESHLVFFYLYLISYAVQESMYLIKLLYEAPRIILEEIFLPEHPCNVHRLQTLSLCGRKVVSWSSIVPHGLLRNLASCCGATESELVLAGAAAAMKRYFSASGCLAPDCVVATARFMSVESLLARANSLPLYGSLCLPLPTDSNQDEPLKLVKSMQKSLSRAQSDQSVLYLASLYRLDHALLTTVLPTIVSRASLYLLSRRYSITLTQVDSTGSKLPSRNLLWGPKLDAVMYWRPPQANVCLSLTLMKYGEGVQLGVMADALLSPHHTAIASAFSEFFSALSNALVPSEANQKIPAV